MIGVFDSGFGGLAILKSFLVFLPEYDYLYLGDSACAPYGNKTHEEIYERAQEALDFFFHQGCSLVIIACNSASSKALRRIQQEYLPKKYPNKKVLGVIAPMVEKISENAKIKRVGVIGTPATISSRAYEKELKKRKPSLKIFSQATPLLAPMVEAGQVSGEEIIQILSEYLLPLREKNIDALILGCTHYPFLAGEIKKIMGDDCAIPDPGEVIAKSLKNYLFKHQELFFNFQTNPIFNFYTTGDLGNFKKMGSKFLGREIKNIKHIDL